MKIGGEPTPWRRIVGIVGDVHHEALSVPPTMQMYTPQAQLTDSFLTVVIRADADPAILASEAPSRDLVRGFRRAGLPGGNAR